MGRNLPAAIIALCLVAAPTVFAQRQTTQGQNTPRQSDSQSQDFQGQLITVSRGGEAYAKPDLGILAMSIRSTSPIADEAVSENARKATAVGPALEKLGFPPQGYKITAVTFGQAGARYGPEPQITAYEASQSVYVFFEAADLADVTKLTDKSAAVIEALRKAGAVPASTNVGGFPMPAAGLIIYTIKDPTPYENEAQQVAITRARDAAKVIAAGTGVQITGLRDVQANFLYGNYGPRSPQFSFEGLTYRWYSTHSDAIEIGANATVQFTFK